MPVRGLDHLAITVADVERTLDFYRRALGAELLYEDLWRAGKIPVLILQLGTSRLSVHAAAKPAKPHARAPTAGSADFCFRWDGPLDAAAAQLAAAGVAIEEGPVPRPAADGRPGASLYFRDPDGNLLELLSTEPSGQPIRGA
jgi:catechol 2,3-dioxygenase-like lactoylglutathione lyase family enzyme